jgi:hypothetical protein
VSRTTTSWLVWILGWLGAFCLIEGLAVFWKNCPWNTFSRTVWDAQTRWDFLTVPIVAVLAILASHLVRLRGIQEGDVNVRPTVRRRPDEAPISPAVPAKKEKP